MAYLAPIHRPSSVRHAITLSFLAPDSPDLIVARSNRLEIWTPAPTSPPTHVLQHSKTVYGRITLLHKIRPATSETDHLFVGTDRYHYFTLSWDPATSSLKTEKSYVDIAEKAARDSQTGDRVAIDPSSRFMALECYEGVINILPIAYPGKGKRRAAESEIGELGDPIPVRIPELFVRSTCFVHKRSPGSKLASPEIALLHEDSTNRVRLKVRMLDYSPSMRPQEEPHTAELEDAKGRGNDKEMDPGSSHLIPLPAPMYGLLVVGETSISYADEWEYNITHTQALKDATVFVAWCAVDAQRYVLADDYGTLYLLFVHQKADGEYSGHQVDVLGETSRASTLVYLDAGMIFVGSHQGDSQIIQIREGSGIEVLQTFANIAPILDFTVMDMGNRSAEAVVNEFSSGQARIVTGSGAFRDGSLRSVRSGVGLEDNGSIGDMGGPVSAVFSLAREPSRSVDVVDTLVVSLVATTRIFCFDGAREVEELEVFGAFSFDEPTIYAGHLVHQEGALLVQVTPSAVLVSQPGLESTKAVQTFAPGKPITAVSADGSTLLLSLGGEALTLISISASAIQTLAQASFEGSQQQVACIALSSAVPDLAVVGFWNGGVSCLSRTTLQETASVHVDVDGEASGAVPRSLLVARILGQTPTLFVGLADGNVVTYTMASAAEPFTARKSIVLGTQQANFTLLPRNSGDGLENVFATCEHPSLIYGSEGRMVYSAVTAEGASVVCAFNAEGFSNAIAIATAEGELKIGSVDEERTTHVQTLPVHETVRRIAYSAELKAFGLGTIKRTLRAGVEEVQSSFKLVDEVAFQELHSYALMTDELVESCIRCQLDDGNGELAERFLVGTAFLDDSVEGTRGRLLVLEITEERRLKVVTELKLKGACRCLAMVEGRIVAALVKTVSLTLTCYFWTHLFLQNVLTRCDRLSSSPLSTRLRPIRS